MEWLSTLFLFLHIGGAIVAFGPTIAFPFLAARAAREPAHGGFVLEASEWLTERVVEPGAVFVFLMGVGLIITKGYSLTEDLWVTTAATLFIITLGYSYFIQLPRLKRMIALTAHPPVIADAPAPGQERAMSGPGTPGAAGAGPAGPPPEFMAMAKATARGGQFMTLMLAAILALMVSKPF
jgi:hypothetical protein